MWTGFQTRLFQPVDGASLAVFRILFGAVIIYEAWRYDSRNWVEAKFLFPSFRFSYQGFEWVEPLPPYAMVWLVKLLAIFAFLVMVGLFYRVAIIGLFTLFSYIFLLDKAQYLNHFYFTILLAFLMVFVPANRVWSFDQMRARSAVHDHVPAWSMWLMRGQMEVMLIWAGIVKLNADWLAGLPLHDWLSSSADDFPAFIERFFLDADFGVFAAWAVAILHVAGAPLLLVPRLRLFVFIVYTTFHLFNHFLWSIGIFPWLTIAGTLLFFDFSWPRQLLAGFRRDAAPVIPEGQPYKVNSAIAVLVVAWLASQAALPLRPYIYDGNVAWNEQGHRFSWRMKLRDKEGTVKFRIVDPDTGKSWAVHTRDFLTYRQERKMVARPDMILEFAHHLRDHWKRVYSLRAPQVFVRSFVSVNGRPYERFIDETTDLATVERTFIAQDGWIRPYSEDKPQTRIIAEGEP
ncbi:HTTM domain-containing protein [Kordiimonas sp.]|uniref:HTTM domain-containing protein n=1 Tax=Kordiimonas sp. TaxID=1970157 RepID=UPI003A8D5A45